MYTAGRKFYDMIDTHTGYVTWPQFLGLCSDFAPCATSIVRTLVYIPPDASIPFDRYIVFFKTGEYVSYTAAEDVGWKYGNL